MPDTPDNRAENEIDRIRRVYEDRDASMPFEEWKDNIYHPRHPLGHLLHQHNHEVIADAINELDIDLRSVSILDVGCGYGYWLRYLVELGARPSNLAGVDLSPRRIAVAKDANPGINWALVEGGSLPFPPESFDLVTQMLVFSSILDGQTRRLLADEINRVTKPGGHVLWIDQRKSRSDRLIGFSRSQVLEYFPGGTIVYARMVQPRYFRRLYGRYSWLARMIYGFTKIGCESWFLIIRK